MKIKLSPRLLDSQLTAIVSGDRITLNGDTLDFSPLGNGELLPLSAINNEWVASDVARIDGEICITLVCPHSQTAPYETRFPDAFERPMIVVDGKVQIPPYESRKSEES
ncbi:hypothetical protein [Aeromonas sp. QDB08]|uniref:hypothetical protein n=1 Tax=Aeromonas sp. QDB08 TaxID=2990480 RepID=UPI0022E946A0|nr:hypothetical protein [Aeromonas sp. QDB08]